MTPAAMAVVESAEAGVEAVALGATIVQLRAPGRTLADLEPEAFELVSKAPVPVVISARVDLALAAGAAGVNLPESDLPVGCARRLLGADALVGRSVHTLEAAKEAQAEGADFVLFGPIYATTSHPFDRPLQGLAGLARVARAVTIPVLAIGGIGWNRVPEVRDAGAAGFAAISAFRP